MPTLQNKGPIRSQMPLFAGIEARHEGRGGVRAESRGREGSREDQIAGTRGNKTDLKTRWVK